MDVRNCRSCGRLFNYMGNSLCNACQQKLEDKFHEVKIFIDEHPEATVNQVAEEMDISVKQIKQWIREERLVLSEASADGILCEYCGIPIRSGRYCDKCKAHVQNTLASAIDKPGKLVEPKKTDKDKNRMRFLQ